MTLGEKIRDTRRSKGVRASRLGEAVSLSPASMSAIENDTLKGGPDPETVVKISSVLEDTSILLCYLEENPVYKAIIPRIFPELNNIRRDPAIIFSRFAQEASEAVEASRILSEIFSNAEPERAPNFEEVFKAKLEQIVDVQRCAEILFVGLIASGCMTEADLKAVHEAQQRKCEARGHHKLNGTEG